MMERDEWAGTAALRASLRERLGLGSATPCLEPPTLLGTELFDGWEVDDLRFSAPDGEAISAFLLRPHAGAAPVPAILYAHAHGNRYAVGRDELFLGRPALRGAYGPDLRRCGIAALCMEMPCFGARQMPGESARSKAAHWRGETLFGRMIWELQAGIGFLSGHPAMDPDRIGALGFSMGSTHALWLAALDTRVRATAAMCSVADLGALVASGAHDGHGPYMTVPGLLDVARTGQIAGLAAPRALHLAAGMRDWSTPPDAFAIARRDAETAYRAAGMPERLSIHVEPETGHVETPEMRAGVLRFLERELFV